MSKNTKHFEKLLDSGNPIGEVISVERFLVIVKGLQPCQLNSLVLFADGSKGFVHEVNQDSVIVLHMGQASVEIGMLAVIQHQELVTKVGKDYIGRVISVNGEPLDGKGPITPSAVWPVFNEAEPLFERKLIEDQLETGVVSIDSLFPIVRGQRMSLMGDSKSGKSTIATQIALNQKNTDQVAIYCLIAKKRTDVDMLLSRLQENNAMDKVIVIVATMLESIISNYLAPYVACSMAEYLWQECDQDTIVIYDDLTSHAHAYREISLLSGVSPGRDSYPGDIFYAHSTLMERAGRLNKNGKTLTSIPIVHVANGDIAAYLPTNIMSITDGQWILDMEIFRSGIRPAISVGQSVTRSGGAGHNARQKKYSARVLRILAEYRQASEFSHFGTELGPEAKLALRLGKIIQQIITQSPSEVYTLIEQQLMLGVIVDLVEGEDIDVSILKLKLAEHAVKVSSDKDFDEQLSLLKEICLTRRAVKKASSQNTPPQQQVHQEPVK